MQRLKAMFMDQNIIFNANFKLGVRGWYGNCCTVFISKDEQGFPREKENDVYCVVSKRKEAWQGLEQDLTERLKANVKYSVTAIVKISSASLIQAGVMATLRLEDLGSPTKYIMIGMIQASSNAWCKINGSFLLDIIPKKVIFYIEGPPPFVDFLVKYVDIRPFSHGGEGQEGQQGGEKPSQQVGSKELHQQVLEHVLSNPNFEEGLQFWYAKGCVVSLDDSGYPVRGDRLKGDYFVVATKRTAGWQGLEQDVSGRLKANKKYEVSAVVRICGHVSTADVLATLWIKTEALQEKYLTLGRVTALSIDWVQLNGNVLLHNTPVEARAYIEGPQAGVDILIDRFSIFSVIKPPPMKPIVEDLQYGENIVENSNLFSGLASWKSLGSCTLNVEMGAPFAIPPIAKESLRVQQPVSGKCIVARNRGFIWEGPSQTITDKIKLFVTYQVSAWVKLGQGAAGPQKVNVVLGVDNQWLNGGEVEGDSKWWKEVAGSFRFETKPECILLYVQGPSPGVDLMVANLQVFPVDRRERFSLLKEQTEKVRKREVVVQVRNKDGCPLSSKIVRIKQHRNSFAIGSCINHYSLENELYKDFFLKVFNWAVFENELKWYWTEKEPNKCNYKEADELCEFCIQHAIPIRGHCIFWEVEDAVQNWVKELDPQQLALAVQNRVVDLLSRYRGRFQHYDVNNEMLHGSFYRSRLGPDIWSYMFKIAHQFDPSAQLFVNDYHVEDGCDMNASPDKYIGQIRDLAVKGAPVGGIGLQGHLTAPIGAIISKALDKLAKVGLPIWFTEVDVSSPNAYLRADDLEVVLREAYAHPSVEGVLLWGFMELAMHRKDSHLVDADGTLNEAGKRLLALQQEWKSNSEGTTDDSGCFRFQGYHGSYSVFIEAAIGKSIEREFEINKGDRDLVVDIQV